MRLEENGIVLRNMTLHDAPLLLEWENDPALWHLNSDNEAPYTLRQIERFIARHTYPDLEGDLQTRLIIEYQDAPVGAIDLFDFDPVTRSAEVGVLIYPPQAKRKGIATHALRILETYAFQNLRLEKLRAQVRTENTSSLGLFAKCGFCEEGKETGIVGFAKKADLLLTTLDSYAEQSGRNRPTHRN